MSTTELITAKDILKDLQKKFGIVDATWVSDYTKSAQSKNITLQEWNHIVKKVSANSSSTEAMYTALEDSLALFGNLEEKVNNFDDRITQNTSGLASEIERATTTESGLATRLNTVESTKLDKVSTPNAVYATDTSGKQTSIPVDYAPGGVLGYKSTMVQRTPVGSIVVTSLQIKDDNSAVNRLYTDAKAESEAAAKMAEEKLRAETAEQALGTTIDSVFRKFDAEQQFTAQRFQTVNNSLDAERDYRYRADQETRAVVQQNITKIDELDAKIDEVESIAKGATQGIVFNDYTHLINHFNSGGLIGKYSSGTNVYILEEDVPDLWICRELPPDDWKEYTDDATLLKEFFENGNKVVQIGLYVLSTLETAKINLTEYVKTERLEGAATLDKLSILDTGYAKSQVVLREDGVHSIGYCDVEYSENGNPKLHQISTSDYLPLVPGDNIEFVVDADKKVVRIRSKGGGGYFEGTAAEYNTVADTVPVGAIVWLIDEEGDLTTAVLDRAILGQMILGTS